MPTLKESKIDIIKVVEWFLYYLVISTAIWVFWFVLSRDLLQTRGGDANIFCLAGQAIRHGRNPYLTNGLGTSDSWNYLPVFVYMFRFLCSRFDFQNTYIFFYFSLFLFLLEIWDAPCDGKKKRLRRFPNLRSLNLEACLFYGTSTLKSNRSESKYPPR